MKKLTEVTVAVVSLCTVLAGCASTGFERARTAAQSSTIGYGEVFEVKAADTTENRAACGKGPNPKMDVVCENLKNFDEARLVFFHSGRFLQRSFFVPTSWHVKDRSIVEVNPAGSTLATRLAALEQRKGCEWTGHPLERLKGGIGAAQGFALGLLIVPAVAVAADDSILQGGVECDGWSYKSLLQNT